MENFNELLTMKKLIVTTHEFLYKALIYSVNEGENRPIEGNYEGIKDIWFFVNSDRATFEGKEVKKEYRGFCVNPDFLALTKNIKFFDSDYTFCGTRNKIKLVESDFQNDFIKWIDRQLSFEGLKSEHERKHNEFRSYIETLMVQPEETKERPKPKTIKDLFTDPKNWEFYTNALCEVEPPLLKKTNGQFEFIGNGSTQTGCIGYYFKELKDKNIISHKHNSNTIAEVLSNHIINFKIKEATVRAETNEYSKKFRQQLESLTNKR